MCDKSKMSQNTTRRINLPSHILHRNQTVGVFSAFLKIVNVLIRTGRRKKVREMLNCN